MSKRGTLIDLALREALKPHGKAVPGSIRDLLLCARKFVLDDSMSAYLADLTNAAFAASPQRAVEMVDGARKLARLPHPVTWIEYNCLARRKRSMSEYPQFQWPTSGANLPDHEIIPRVGWLLVQHSKIPTAFVLTEFCEVDDAAVMLPYCSAWTSDDASVIPWRGLPWSNRGNTPSELATGIIGYRTDKVNILATRTFDFNDEKQLSMEAIMKDTAGELRAAWCLLATINDLPTLVETVRPSKGYVARGRYRRFVDHSIIRLNVPAHRSLKTLAARAVATIRRRAHQVRGHWRKDWRHVPATLCDHDWIAGETVLTCSRCGGKRLWITEHQRGDASLGIVTHDYAVTHDTDR